MGMSGRQRYRIVLEEARRVFENGDVARAWIEERSIPLGNVTPLSLLETDDGMKLVLRELGQIEYSHPV